MAVKEPVSQFEKRKMDHLRLSLEARHQTAGLSGFDELRLQHESVPDLDFDPESSLVGETLFGSRKPFLVSSMTAGHVDSIDFNLRLAQACSSQGWLMGVGSQRRELFDLEARKEWLRLKKDCPDVSLIGNLGLTQLIQTETQLIRDLLESMGAIGLFVHTNPLQEVMQEEGTPQFKGAHRALERLCKELSVPVILKETGCGFSQQTLQRLVGVGLAAVDVSGLGGTHWGRIEGGRAQTSLRKKAASTFENWGIGTVESLINANQVAHRDYRIWASGGLRSGIDALKAFCLGAEVVGFAKPALEAAMTSAEAVIDWMAQVEFEVRSGLFLVGAETLFDLKVMEVLKWQKS